MGMWIAGTGLLLLLIGILVHVGAFSWFGRLPGDIRIDGESTRVHIPLVSMLLVSLGLTLVVNVALRLLRR